MGKLRLKLQAMMPSVWYRKLKMELRMRAGGSHQQGAMINYKRWSSQRKQMFGSSKKLLIKASPLIPSPISASFSQLEEHNESHISPAGQPAALEESKCHVEQRQTHFADPLSPPPLRYTTGTCSIALKASETYPLEEEVPHPKALCTSSTQLPQQAPSLSSPLPLSDKSFQLNLQELNSKLKALNYEQRRTYYSSPLFAAATPPPVFDKLDLDLMVKNSFEPNNESLVARKLFSEEDKLFTNVASRSSLYGSTSLTGQSNTSSEDTAFDKASSSSIWERDFSSLPSEGSELFPAMEKIQNTIAFLRRKSRKARKDASLKQRRRQKDMARGKLSHALEEFNHFDDSIHCFDDLCQCREPEKVSSIEKLKMALAGSRGYTLHSSLADESHSMQAQSENSFNAKRQDNDDYLRHRRSVSNESLFLETIGVNQAFNKRSPWQHNDAGFDKFSPSDSAFSDSELESCRSHRSIAMQERYGTINEHSRQPPKPSLYFDRDTVRSSPKYDDAFPEFSLPVWRQHPANLPHPPLSKSKSSTNRSLHSSVFNAKKSLSSLNKESFYASCAYSPSSKSRGGYEWGAPCDNHEHNKSILSERNKSGLNICSPSARTGSRRTSSDISCDDGCKGCSRSFNTWGASPETSDRSKLLKDVSTMSSDSDDYDGDVSLRSYNECCMVSTNRSYSKLTEQYGGKDCDAAAMFSTDPSTLATLTSLCHSWVPQVPKSACKMSINEDHESLQGLISVPSWSKMLSKGGGDGNVSGAVASPSESPTSLNKIFQIQASKERMAESVQSVEGQKDGNESIQSHSRGTRERASRTLTRTRETNGKDVSASLASLIEREMDNQGATATESKSGSRREQLNGVVECRAEVKGRDDKDCIEKGKEGENGQVMRGAGNMKEGVDGSDVEKSKVYESFAMVKCSNNPSQDFKESMMEMVLHKKLQESLDLVELLQCYLSLNAPCYHDIIVKAFIDLWSDHFRPSI
ncbi:hypothetical protein L7F22_025940 [Adiantum nelumboides]|nr:hypothetical protein [Adiantum nelumboides]